MLSAKSVNDLEDLCRRGHVLQFEERQARQRYPNPHGYFSLNTIRKDKPNGSSRRPFYAVNKKTTSRDQERENAKLQ